MAPRSRSSRVKSKPVILQEITENIKKDIKKPIVTRQKTKADLITQNILLQEQLDQAQQKNVSLEEELTRLHDVVQKHVLPTTDDTNVSARTCSVRAKPNSREKCLEPSSTVTSKTKLARLSEPKPKQCVTKRSIRRSLPEV
jgi:hypothetical protein